MSLLLHILGEIFLGWAQERVDAIRTARVKIALGSLMFGTFALLFVWIVQTTMMESIWIILGGCILGFLFSTIYCVMSAYELRVQGAHGETTWLGALKMAMLCMAMIFAVVAMLVAAAVFWPTHS